MDRVGGVGHQHHVPGLHRGQDQVGQPLLGPDGGDGLGLRVDVHVEPALVPVGNGYPQLGDAPGGRIAVVGGLARGFDELVHDVLRGGQVGVAHPQIDDILPPAPGHHFQGVDRGKDIGRQTFHPGEFFNGHAGLLRANEAVYP